MSEPVESEHEYQKGCQQQYGWNDSKSKDHNNSWNSKNVKDRNNISKAADGRDTSLSKASSY
jgi:hypothetical protein